jgi:hypothetical protein
LNLAVSVPDLALHGPVHFEGQNFHDEEDVVLGDEGAVAGQAGFGEKALSASFVTAALADFLTDFLIVLHFCLISWVACCIL